MALEAGDPAEAARYAVESMGMFLVAVDDAGRHYLAAHDSDPYSLVYVPGTFGVDHISYVVPSLAQLDVAEALLQGDGVSCERVAPSPLAS